MLNWPRRYSPLNLRLEANPPKIFFRPVSINPWLHLKINWGAAHKIRISMIVTHGYKMARHKKWVVNWTVSPQFSSQVFSCLRTKNVYFSSVIFPSWSRFEVFWCHKAVQQNWSRINKKDAQGKELWLVAPFELDALAAGFLAFLKRHSIFVGSCLTFLDLRKKS